MSDDVKRCFRDLLGAGLIESAGVSEVAPGGTACCSLRSVHPVVSWLGQCPWHLAMKSTCACSERLQGAQALSEHPQSSTCCRRCMPSESHIDRCNQTALSL